MVGGHTVNTTTLFEHIDGIDALTAQHVGRIMEGYVPVGIVYQMGRAILFFVANKSRCIDKYCVRHLSMLLVR